MKTIAAHSIKGGSGKTTMAAVSINALSGAGYRCLAIDADASNNSLSFHLDDSPELEQGKTIFNLFMGDKVEDCAKRINDRLDLIRGNVRLNEFRSTDSLKKLKRSLQGLEYDFVIIDTSPTYDNIIGNVLTASDILLIPVQQDLFTFQALRYQFEKLADLELDNLDTYIIFNQFDRPQTENQDAYRNQITNLFLENETFKPFINPNRISRSSAFRKYINKEHYRIDGNKTETMKVYEEIKSLIKNILDIDIKEGF